MDKKPSDISDITMGSFDGAELSELVELYSLGQLKKKFSEINFAIYRYDVIGSHKPYR